MLVSNWQHRCNLDAQVDAVICPVQLFVKKPQPFIFQWPKQYTAMLRTPVGDLVLHTVQVTRCRRRTVTVLPKR